MFYSFQIFITNSIMYGTLTELVVVVIVIIIIVIVIIAVSGATDFLNYQNLLHFMKRLAIQFL